MSKQKTIWECKSCGHTQSKWAGSCLSCSSWNTFHEKLLFQENDKRFESKKTNTSSSVKLKDINVENFKRIKTNITEFDRLLGGGVTLGSLVLIGGEPGIGKSTLLLQLADIFSNQNLKVLYISGEESIQQTTLRAKRINVTSDNIYLFSETNFSLIKNQIDLVKPDILIVDSIQILYKEEVPSSPGSVVQVRELANEFMHIAKGHGITTFLIGHVTKSKELAGPKLLEHIVDVVLDFEGERQLGFRLLRSIKNRFGPTDDIALFQMKQSGLEQILNPSAIFLEKRVKNLSGNVVVPTIEGIRAILIEVQALVSTSFFPNPTRKCAGLDQNRLALLLAVLEKRVKFQLYNCDVFVSIAGGMRIKEPAIDLAILMAIASSFSNRKIDSQTAVIGEVGLGGEIRAVSRIEARIKEAKNMGFTKIVVPQNNFKEISKNLKTDTIQIYPISLVDQAIEIMN
ncbi:MAG: DNA repair protein RadA [Parachlamydiales bacterium]|nr:DNA repair protein RadA [Parachlamydiales bacterium]